MEIKIYRHQILEKRSEGNFLRPKEKDRERKIENGFTKEFFLKMDFDSQKIKKFFFRPRNVLGAS